MRAISIQLQAQSLGTEITRGLVRVTITSFSFYIFEISSVCLANWKMSLTRYPW